MTCYHPIPAFKSNQRGDTGRYGVIFKPNPRHTLVEGSSFQVPCGRCIGCRLDRSRDWAVRCMHEASLHPENCFLTLTYDDKHLPSDYSVDVRVHQLFMKRLREFAPQKVRFFACGEYGEQDLRPHYHYLLFNYRPHDLKLHSRKNENQLFTSSTIQKLWPYGFSTIGNLTYKTAAYTARYVIKKIGGSTADEYYTRVHPLSGNLVRVKPEFAKQSLRPGIGDGWFKIFKSDIYPSDFCVVEGKRHAVPKFYVKKLAEEEAHKIKLRRKAMANKKRADNTPARLKVREQVQTAQVSLLKRKI